MCKDVNHLKDVIISITGVQNFPQGSDDTVELVTEGKYCYRDGKGELSYMESELDVYKRQVQGGWRPWWQQGSSVTYIVAPAGDSVQCARALRSACASPQRSWKPSPMTLSLIHI